MNKTILAVLTGSILLASAGLAVAPQRWAFRSADDFLRGRFEGVSVTSDGVLTLAPREERIEGPTEDFFLSFLAAPDGAAYLGTGHSGRIYKISKEGKAEPAAQVPEMDVTCLAVDGKGVLYAGTSPNGKIYKITKEGKPAEFFDPRERYIWALAFAENGSLFAAVGESGGIYEILPEGQGRMIFTAPENHILCLKFDRTKDIIAGAGGGGLVYRVSRTGKAAVIFETPFEEVRSLALDLDGNIYAAAGGTSTRARRDDLPLAQAGPGRDADVSVSVSAVVAAPAPPSPQTAPASARTSGPGSAVSGREPGALFRIGPDGVAKRIWASGEDMIYSLYWNETEKKVYFGTGPKGRLFALGKDEKATLVLQKNSEQIYALEPVGVRTYILADNPAQLSVLYPDRRLSGEYQGPVLDAKIVSSWGRLSWTAELPQGGTLQFQTRSGNAYEPGPGWSDWSPPYQKKDGEQVLSPKSRYLQVRALFKAIAGPASPALSRMSVFYLQTNIAPGIARLEALAPNEVFLKLPLDQDEVILALERRNPDPAGKKDDPLRFSLSKKVERKGYQTITWDADDENGDALQYSISIRSDGDKAWRVLEDRWSETLYTFNTLNFPDGVYVLKVAASDLPSNPPDLEKRGERETPPLTVDNTAPALRNVQVARNGTELTVSFFAEDALSAIKDVKYLIRPDEWRMVFPEDGICDARQESFKFKAALPPGADGQITIVVKDACGNVLTFKQAF